VEAAETAYARLARDVDRIVVAGLSAGGALACHLAASYPGILGIVAINPATRSPGPDVLAALEAARAAGFAALPPTPSDIADPTVPEPLDGGTPVIGLLSLLAGLDTVPYAAVRTPILLFSSRVDHVVDPCHGDHLVATAAGPVERVWLERSWHVATRDYDKELLFAAAIAFVARVAGGGSPAPRGIHRAASER
jgi:carboxylesterase